MNLFEVVKAGISTREAAQAYGIDVNRHGMALCPFHNDRHPSLYVSDDHYHCFACGEHGDVIDLTAKLFDLRLYDAARKLASDFHLAPDKPLPEAIRRKNEHKTKAQQLRENEQLCFSVLNEYRRLLLDWKKRYAPQAPEDSLDKRFVSCGTGRCGMRRSHQQKHRMSGLWKPATVCPGQSISWTFCCKAIPMNEAKS